MNLLINKEKINLYLNYFILFYSGTFLINSNISRIILVILFLLWILEGNFKNKIIEIFNQKIFLVYFGIILMFFISLIFFSENVVSGWWNNKYETGFEYLLNKPIKYSIIMLILFTSLKENFLVKILVAFLLQVIYISLYSLGIMFSLFEAASNTYYPFINHIYLSIMINTSIFISIYLFFKSTNNFCKYLYMISMFFLIYTLYKFTGRTGQLSFIIISLSILVFIFVKYLNIKKTFLVFLVFSITFFLFFYFFNFEKSKSRYIDTQRNITNIFENNNYENSIGYRLLLTRINFDLLTKNIHNFVFGLGMGDARERFNDIINVKYKDYLFLLKFEHVHNQYIQTWIDGGIISLFLYLLFYYLLIKIKLQLYEKLFLVSIVMIFIFYGFSGIIFSKTKMIEFFTLFIGLFITMKKFDQ